ncbi:hypothetical protein ABZT27_14555 [Streptomyces sp. NPDC005389]|uniref:hypothetical protein n=1 Tax=Streptomyces sp. NPDC005389 TaxID=3157040 RepID=UPI0033A4629C
MALSVSDGGSVRVRSSDRTCGSLVHHRTGVLAVPLRRGGPDGSEEGCVESVEREAYGADGGEFLAERGQRDLGRVETEFGQLRPQWFGQEVNAVVVEAGGSAPVLRQGGE